MANKTLDTHTHTDENGNITVHNHDHSETPELLIASTVLDLTLPWKEIEPVYEEVLRQMAKKVKSPGFRPGKVPTMIAKDIIGEDRLKDETAQRLMPNAYKKLIEKSGKQPLTQPEIQGTSMDLNADWTFTVSIAEKPTVSVKDHAKVVKAAKKEAQKELAEQAKTKKTDKESTSKSPAKPPVDPQAQERETTMQFIFKGLITTFKPQVPELLLKQETRAELEEMVRSLEQMQMKLDDYLARRQITFEQLTNEVATQMLGKLQLDILYSAIIDDQKFTATEADVQKFLDRIEDKKVREAQSKDERYLAYIRTLILRDKVTEYLLAL